MMNQVQRYLARIPVVKAWVFGSFARGEETPQSDLDILVDYDKATKLSLLDAIRFKLDLEKLDRERQSQTICGSLCRTRQIPHL